MYLKKEDVKLIKMEEIKTKPEYLKIVRELIKDLENPLAEVKDVLNKLNQLELSEEKKQLILKNLKKAGDVFEPRKDMLKTLD